MRHVPDEYVTRHDAILLLWDAYDRADFDIEGFRIRGRIRRAINYLRNTALDLIPYGATTPNKDSHGRRYGKRV